MPNPSRIHLNKSLLNVLEKRSYFSYLTHFQVLGSTRYCGSSKVDAIAQPYSLVSSQILTFKLALLF